MIGRLQGTIVDKDSHHDGGQEYLDDFRRTTGLPVGDIYRLKDVTALVVQYRIRIG
jgi:hypothetical protein